MIRLARNYLKETKELVDDHAFNKVSILLLGLRFPALLPFMCYLLTCRQFSDGLDRFCRGPEHTPRLFSLAPPLRHVTVGGTATAENKRAAGTHAH